MIEREQGFWNKIVSALQRWVVLFLLMGVHWLLDRGLTLTIPVSLGSLLTLAKGIFWVFFLALYVMVGWSMVAVFIPLMREREHFFWRKIVSALQLSGTLLGLMGVHWLLDRGLTLAIVAPPLPLALTTLARAVISVCFLLIYINILWDTTAIFIPLIRPKFERDGATVEHQKEQVDES